MSRADNFLNSLVAVTTGAALYGQRRSYIRDPEHQFINIPNLVTPNQGTSAPRYYTRGAAKRLRSGSAKRTLFTPSYPEGEAIMPRPYNRRGVARRTQFRTNLGRRAGKYSTRRHAVKGDAATIPDKTMASFRLMQIPYDADESKINTRRGNQVKVSGVKLRIQFKLNNLPTSDANQTLRPLMVRWAIINPKVNNGGLTVPTEDFFISSNPVSKQSEDFPALGPQFVWMNRKINRELYGVLKQGQFILQNSPSGNASSGTQIVVRNTGMRGLNIYVPIKRQMIFEATTSTVPTENIYFCYWYCQLGDGDDAKVFDTGSKPISQFHEHITYFRNSAMFG